MNFTWAKNDVASSSVTLSDSNITLNKAACASFENVRFVLLGYDKESRQIAIKPVTKEEINLNKYNKNNLHKLSLGKSYGRISNKNFMTDIAKMFSLNYGHEKGLKYDAYFDEDAHVLIVEL